MIIEYKKSSFSSIYIQPRSQIVLPGTYLHIFGYGDLNNGTTLKDKSQCYVRNWGPGGSLNIYDGYHACTRNHVIRGVFWPWTLQRTLRV